jgi:hypothetical protein
MKKEGKKAAPSSKPFHGRKRANSDDNDATQ